MKADLHTHTTISDCSLTQEEVVKQAQKNKVTHLAITDHDTTMGLSEALALGEKYSVEIIPGIEISAYDYQNDKKCHIVGLYVPIDNKELQNFTAPVNQSRKDNFATQISNLTESGYNISMKDFQFRGELMVYKQHIMDVLIAKGYAQKIYGAKYQELFKGDGICNLKVNYPDALEAVRLLRAVNAFPVLAHPGIYDNFDIIEDLVDSGLMGIEGVYPHCSAQDYALIEQLSNKYDLLITGGTDIHGHYSDNPTAEVGDYSVDPSVLTEIKKLLL